MVFILNKVNQTYILPQRIHNTFYIKCSVASNDLVIFNYFTIKTFYKPLHTCFELLGIGTTEKCYAYCFFKTLSG